MTRPAVPRSLEFDRIAALPRRVLSLGDAKLWGAVLTEHLRDPDAPADLSPLRPWQAMAELKIK